MDTLLHHAHAVADLLRQRGETVAVAESSAGGLIAAALLAVPGASEYFAGGAVPYTRKGLARLMNVEEARLRDAKPSTEDYALLKARLAREHLDATWGIGENGVAGPTPNRYGVPPGHCCLAVSGPRARSITLQTGDSDRLANMMAFAAGALELLTQVLRES